VPPPSPPALLILCPNLCLDRIIVVRGFTAGRVQRAESAAALASGKGLNVGRAARVLGAAVTVAGVTGDDDAGRSIARGARAHGIHLRAVRVAGASRVCTLIVDPEREETVINEPGPAADAGAVRRLLDAVRAAARRARALVLAGSLPPGAPDDLYAQAIATARRAAPILVLLDAAGPALRLGLAARPDLVKVNRIELAEATGRRCSSPEEVLAAAERLQTDLRCRVLVTMGAEGAALVAAEGRWLLGAPPVRRVNTIGAGDSLTAGLIVSLLRKRPLLDAARIGMAAAAADVATLLPGTIERVRVRHLLPQVVVKAA
jgi:1-phosphofructokinase family hexose kinase